MVPSASRFEPKTREKLRRRMIKYAATLATILTDVLAGRDKTSILTALGILRPGVPPELALHRALDQVERRQILLISDDDHYGRCEVCAADLDIATLEEMAWADRCCMHMAT